MSAVSSLASLGMDIALRETKRSSERETLRSEEKRRTRDLLSDVAEESRKQQTALERRLAQERARAGAMGVGGYGGSADAVLRGLVDEDESQRAARRLEVAEKIEALRSAYGKKQRRSLLDTNDDWLRLTNDRPRNSRTFD